MADSTVGFEFGGYAGNAGNGGPTAEASTEELLLLEGLKRGDQEAYERLLVHFEQPVYNLICRLSSDPGEASDMTQEVFIKVFRSIGTFQAKSSLKTWIYRIAVNEAYNHRRWFSRHRKQEIGLESERNGRTFGEQLSDERNSPFDRVLGRETRAMIEEAMAELNPNFRTAVVLRDIEELSYEEIAAILQISPGTVKSRILRGREALRRALAEKLERRPAMQWSPQTVE